MSELAFATAGLFLLLELLLSVALVAADALSQVAMRRLSLESEERFGS